MGACAAGSPSGSSPELITLLNSLTGSGWRRNDVRDMRNYISNPHSRPHWKNLLNEDLKPVVINRVEIRDKYCWCHVLLSQRSSPGNVLLAPHYSVMNGWEEVF